MPRYGCNGSRVDRAVAAAVLDAIHPAGVEAALEALARGLAAHHTTRQALALALEKARDETQRARRQDDLVDPANRLVAGEFERRWNETLAQVAEVEAHLATLERHPITLSAEQRQG